MKKIRLVAAVAGIAVAFALFATGCTSQEEAVPEENVDYEIALVTDDGLVMDGGHSEVAWNTIVEFGGTHGISHKYYKAVEPSDKAFIKTIREAINHGAKIVIVDNSSMENATYKMQEEYPEIKFVMTDTEPYGENGDIKIDSNTAAVSFDSAQAGFLAGYAAVIEGYDSIGFIGQDKSTRIRNFGIGYVKGAEKAASETGIAVEVDYRYCSGSGDTDDACEKAQKMYIDGCDVVFAAGEDIQDSVVEAAEGCEGRVIGSITDQSAKSDRVITSATYNISKALEEILQAYAEDEFPGGEVIAYNASNDGIGLELKNNRLETIVQDQYDEIYESLAEGDIKIKTDIETPVREMELTGVSFK